MVSIQQAALSVSQSARNQWAQREESSKSFRDSVDSLIRTMFAPCAGNIGGVPRDELPRTQHISPLLVRKQSSATPVTVPFEVSASSSSLSRSSPPAERESPAPFQRESLSKLRQLGAQHQLASGMHGESLADVARPCSPEHNSTPDLVDFDDGISAISSHTLEEMEKRTIQSGRADVRRVGRALKETLRTPIREDVEWEAEFSEFPSFEPENAFSKVEISRNESINTRRTNATEESFQKFMAQEATYWDGEVKQDTGMRRKSGRPSIEERARTIRELSRSRSRSDGAGGTSKSSLLGSHPHDTVPIFSYDLFYKKTRTRSSSSRSKKESLNDSDPFEALDYAEI